MKRISKSGGYTILEVLIVIAVTASMFVVAVIALGGRQQEVEFSQSVRDLDSKLQDIMNDVAVGFYNNAKVDCNTSDPGRPVLTVSDTAVSQGSRGNCVSIGKVLQFAPDGYKDKINIYTVLGRRTAAGTGNAIESLADAQPVLVGGTTTSGEPLEAFVSSYQLQWGLHITDVVSSTASYGGIGFFTSFARNVAGDQVSNSQFVRYSGIPTTVLDSNQTSFVNKADKITDSPSPLPGEIPLYLTGDKRITICLGTPNGRRAAIYIGGDRNTTTRVDFDNYDPTICQGTL